MDEPFRKRPRLSMFPSDEHLDDDLGGRRTRNDLLLKSRFESIFEKYSHDFSSVGDEIDMDSLTVVVNNGHLQSMENETDPGGLQGTRGQSLLRAMTEVLGGDEEEYYNTGADEIMDSIEEIAQSAAMAEDQEEIIPMDSDEELFLPVNARASYITPPDSRESLILTQSDVIDSEPGSLFEVHPLRRSDSPDSLFEVQLHPSTDSNTSDLFGFASQDKDIEDDAIMQKFGPQVGLEVLGIIQRARNVAYQAHIEPAWRIPISVAPPEPRQSISKSKTPTAPILVHSEVPQTISPEHAKSLWKPTRFRSTKRATHQARVKRRIRAESEDPLQEDFVSGEERAQPKFDNGDASDWEAEQRPKKNKKTKVDEQAQRQEEIHDLSDLVGEESPKNKTKAAVDEEILQMRKGTCFYCQKQWTSRGGVFKHWVKLATQFDKGEIDDDDVHDLEHIQVYVSTSNRAAKGPRLGVSDFKTLVELHEGAGISFDEIAELKALRTKKNGLALNDVYDRYRNLSDRLLEDTRGWSNEEMQKLHELCQNPKRDVGSFAVYFQNRSNTDIGEKLAEVWLGALIDSGQVFARAVQQPTSRAVEADYARPQQDPESFLYRRLRGHDTGSDDELFIKQEPGSDDELFGRT